MYRILLSLLLLCCPPAIWAQMTVVDVNADGRFTAADIDALVQSVLRFDKKADGNSVLIGDMNRDGQLSIADVTLLTDAGLYPAYTLPYESPVLNEDDWLVVSGTARNPWLKGTQYVQATGYQAWDGASKKSNREVEGYLISPAFCTRSSQGGVTMSFDDVICYTNNDANYKEHVKIYASTTADGTSFDPSEWKELDWTVSHVRNDWTLTTTDIALPAEFVGKDRVRIAFWFYAPSTGSTTFEFNNFRLYESVGEGGGGGEDIGAGEGGGVDPEPSFDPDDLNSNTISLAGSFVKTETGAMSSTYIGRIEMPRLCGDDTFVVHQDTGLSGSPVNYSIAYDEAKHHSRWVAFRFDGKVGVDGAGRNDSFKADPLFSSSSQPGTSFPSGYDRGHICASNDRQASVAGNKQTFYMSNMSPQLSKFNQVYWNYYESHLQNIVRSGNNFNTAFADTVYVVKGGTISADKVKKNLSIGSVSVPVPSYYFIALLKVKGGQYSAIGFWMEHRDNYAKPSNIKTEILAHAVTIDELERLTGIDFFCNLPASIETPVEATFTADDWGL